VGGRADLPIDVRVLAATHRDLRAQVNGGGFRLDLFYRLAVVTIEAPPLRERLEDLPLLLEHFLELAGHAGPASTLFPEDTLRRLERHDWPGNVRELRNLVVSTVALGAPPGLGGTLAAEGTTAEEETSPALVQSYRDARAELVREFERTYLTALLRRTGGNVRQAARDAQMDRSYLIELLRRHGLG
jgi:DNA-binding NtrC family response regulator